MLNPHYAFPPPPGAIPYPGTVPPTPWDRNGNTIPDVLEPGFGYPPPPPPPGAIPYPGIVPPLPGAVPPTPWDRNGNTIPDVLEPGFGYPPPGAVPPPPIFYDPRILDDQFRMIRHELSRIGHMFRDFLSSSEFENAVKKIISDNKEN